MCRFREIKYIVLAVLVLGTAALSVFAQEPETHSEEPCLDCHEDLYETMQEGLHAEALETRTARGYQGCQGCHWPGEAHAEDPSEPMFAFRDESAHLKSSRCLECHQKHGVGQSVHQRGGLACNDCHVSGHGVVHKREFPLLKEADWKLCSSCHARQKIQMQLPFRHRTSDGVLKCGDCHEPHATAIPRSRRLNGDEECFKCHTDKQGPFVFEHTPVSVTGCESCHEVHGSTNPRLLVRSQMRFLCLECHSNTSRAHDLSQQRFQQCTLCHTAIHGSFVDSKFLR